MREVVNVISHFMGLITLKKEPQNLAYSMRTFTLLFLLLALCIKLTLQNSIPQLAKVHSIIPVFIIIYEGLFLSVLYFMLTKTGKKNRFIQSACNFLGLNIINCIIVPIICLLPLQLFFLCLTKAWLFMINIHITKHAFSVNQMRAAIIYLFINAIALLTITVPFVILKLSSGGTAG